MYTEYFSSRSLPGANTEHDYTLMNKDRPLVQFRLQDIGNELFQISHITPLASSPFEDEKSLRMLITRRKPVKNREHITKLLQLMQINSISGYLDVSYGLSLNDTLWFRPAMALECINWQAVDLYDNDFDETIACFAFCGQGVAKFRMNTISPEFGTDGMLPKCWHREEDGQIYLYKGGTSGCSNTGNEPYSEYMCSAILEVIGVSNFVPYTLKSYHNTLVSSCPLFTSKEIGYAPICNYINPIDFMDIVEAFSRLGLREAFEDILVFDALVYNTDRHLNNYGLLVNNDTYAIEGMAPIFDNGWGMLPFYTMDKDINEYARRYDYQNSGVSNNDVLSLCLKDRHKKLLTNLVGFKFPKHPLFNLPAERVERLEQLLQRRLQYILSKEFV